MQERRERFFVRREDLFGELIGVMERASAQDPAAKIALADNQEGAGQPLQERAGPDRGAGPQRHGPEIADAIMFKIRILDNQIKRFIDKKAMSVDKNLTGMYF